MESVHRLMEGILITLPLVVSWTRVTRWWPGTVSAWKVYLAIVMLVAAEVAATILLFEHPSGVNRIVPLALQAFAVGLWSVFNATRLLLHVKFVWKFRTAYKPVECTSLRVIRIVEEITAAYPGSMLVARRQADIGQVLLMKDGTLLATIQVGDGTADKVFEKLSYMFERGRAWPEISEVQRVSVNYLRENSEWYTLPTPEGR